MTRRKSKSRPLPDEMMEALREAFEELMQESQDAVCKVESEVSDQEKFNNEGESWYKESAEDKHFSDTAANSTSTTSNRNVNQENQIMSTQDNNTQENAKTETTATDKTFGQKTNEFFKGFWGGALTGVGMTVAVAAIINAVKAAKAAKAEQHDEGMAS